MSALDTFRVSERMIPATFQRVQQQHLRLIEDNVRAREQITPIVSREIIILELIVIYGEALLENKQSEHHTTFELTVNILIKFISSLVQGYLELLNSEEVMTNEELYIYLVSLTTKLRTKYPRE